MKLSSTMLSELFLSGLSIGKVVHQYPSVFYFNYALYRFWDTQRRITASRRVLEIWVGLKVIQGYWKQHHSIEDVRFLIHVTQ